MFLENNGKALSINCKIHTNIQYYFVKILLEKVSSQWNGVPLEIILETS